MYAHELSPSERDDVQYLYGTSIEDALSMDKTLWDDEQGFDYIEGFDIPVEYRHTYVLDFDVEQATMLHPHNHFSPIVYELPSEEIFTIDDEMYENVFDAEDLQDPIDELYKYASANPYTASRIKNLVGAPTGIQLLDYAAKDIRDDSMNYNNMQFAFDEISKFLGLKVRSTDKEVPIDHLNGIDVFLIPDDSQTERSGIFKNIDGVNIGGFAFIQANGRYAMVIKDGNANLYVTAHEFGHILDYISSGQDLVTDKISPDMLNAAGINMEHTTRYGSTKDSELFADSFAIASLALSVDEVKYVDGKKHIQITRITRKLPDEERILRAIFGQRSRDTIINEIHTKYHNLFTLMLKQTMPNASAAIQKNKKRLKTR